MNKKIVWSAFVSVLLLSTVIGAIWSLGVYRPPLTWKVGPGGPPVFDFSTVHEATDSSRVIGGDTIKVYAGTYYEFITIDKPLNVVGVNGSDLTIIDAGMSDTDTVITIKSSNVRIENLTLQHTGYRYGAGFIGAGIRLRTDQLPIDGVVIRRNVLSNLDIGIDIGYTPSQHSYVASASNISANTITRSTLEGMHLSDVVDFRISENRVIDNPFTSAIRLVNTNGTQVFSNYLFDAKTGLGLEGGYSNNASYNTIENIQTNGISCEGHFNDLAGNNITDVLGVCIIERGSNNNIDHNTIMGASGISVNGNFSTAYENIIKGGNGVGISVAGFSNDIRSNSVTEKWSQGIFVRGATNNITDNIVQRVDTGIYGAAFMSGNKIQDCSAGIDVPFTVENVTLISNFVENCSEGIGVSGNSTINVSSNTLISCPRGLHVINSSTCIVYHNMFLNSSAADDCERFGNSWNMSKTMGGNYWDDYEYEDSTGDGFGDTPYVIRDSYGNKTTDKDYYPLVVPPFPIPVSWNDQTGSEKWSSCMLIGNVTVSRFHFDRRTKTITFNLTGHGYCNLTIPKDLLYGSFDVSFDDIHVPAAIAWSDTHTSICLACQNSSPYHVQIIAQFNLNCDLNDDGIVNIADLVIVAKAYGTGLEP